MVAAAQEYLFDVDLKFFVVHTQSDFRSRLDESTNSLTSAFPIGGQHWGTARKILNLFLRNSRYNAYLSEDYRLAAIDQWLEIPLDAHVASNLHLRALEYQVSLPRWSTIKTLRPDVSDQYQALAQVVADARGTLRAHLDLFWWRNPAKK